MDPSRWDWLPVQFLMNFESSPKRTSELGEGGEHATSVIRNLGMIGLLNA
jgi:hypothetical protein